MVCRAVKKVHDQIQASALPRLPLIWTEYNASYMNETDVTDSICMGPWMADTIRQCDGLTDMMSYWTFSDVFEEQGVVEPRFMEATDLSPKTASPNQRSTLSKCFIIWATCEFPKVRTIF